MKTLLLLTDLSKKAENAALYGLKLAEKLQANIILYHAFAVFQPAIASEAGVLIIDDYESVKADSLNELQKLAALLDQQRAYCAVRPTIEILNDAGSLGNKVPQLVKDKKVDMIVMGSKSDDAISHLFFGSETSNVLETAACPILFVPDNISYTPLNKIVFSTDLKKAYPKALSFIVELATHYNAGIDVVHIGNEGEFTGKACIDLIQCAFEYPKAKYHQIPGEHVIDKLKGFVQNSDASLVVMIYHQHLLLRNMVSGSNSKKMLQQHQSPLMVLPE